MSEIKFHKAHSLPNPLTEAHDGIWFIFQPGRTFKAFIVSNGNAIPLNYEDAINFSNLTNNVIPKKSPSGNALVDSNITDITEGVEVDGTVKTRGVQLNDTTTTPLPNQITRNGDKLKYTDTTGTTRDVMVGFTTSNDGDIEFMGDGTPANPLHASVANKIPYKAIDTSTTPPDLAQLIAHGTDRVDFPNLNRIYFLNGAKWTYVETIDI